MEEVPQDPQALGRRIIELNRKVRLGDTSMDEWAQRISRLLAKQPDLDGDYSIVSVKPPEGGAGSSSGTLFVEASVAGSGVSATRKFVLRFAPAEPLFHVYDLDGQVRIQRGLAVAGLPVPAQCWEDIGGRSLGVPGYIMERAIGEAAPGAWFAEGVIAQASPDERRQMIFAFVHTLAELHKVDWRRHGLSFLLDRADGEGLIGREVNWYWDALEWAGEDASMSSLSSLRDWLIANQPADSIPAMCHGDANFTNALFSGGEISALLDWEMAFIGTPECDISYLLAGMGALTDTFPEGVPTPDEIVAEYERVSGHRLQSMAYYRLFSLYRIVVIHFLGMRAFPPEFQAAFKAYVDGLVAKMWGAARDVGAA